MRETLDAFASLLGDFSLRRLLWLLSLAIVLGAAATAYERASAAVKLQRIERTAELARKLQALDSARISNDATLGKVQTSLKVALLTVAEDRATIPNLVAFAPDSLATALRRFFSGATIWLLLSIGMASTGLRIERQQGLINSGKPLPRGEKKETMSRSDATRSTNVAAVFALLLGSMSIFLPLYESWWFLAVVYPITSLVIGLGLSGLIELIAPPRRGNVSS